MTILETRFRPPVFSFLTSLFLTVILLFFLIKIISIKVIQIELLSLLLIFLLITINIFIRSGRSLFFYRNTGLIITDNEIIYSEPGYLSVITIKIKREDIVKVEKSGESILIKHNRGDLILRARNFIISSDQIIIALRSDKI